MRIQCKYTYVKLIGIENVVLTKTLFLLALVTEAIRKL